MWFPSELFKQEQTQLAHFTMNKTIFIAAVLAAATLLAAGLVVFPGLIQEAQANPCSSSTEEEGEGDLSTSDLVSTVHNKES